jgi:uncharacterized repeat protein (TIGR04076 family)
MLGPAMTEMRLCDLRITRHFCIYALQSVLPLLPAKQRQLPESDWLRQAAR